MSNQPSKPFVDIENAREDDQREVMREIVSADHCPFCRENLEKYHKQEIIKEGKYWLVTTNQWPYDHTSLHLLLIYKNHAERLAELDPQAGTELIELVQWVEKHYQIPGGGVAMRFGDMNYSAGTVAHIHAQLLVPDIEATDYDENPVRVKIGKMWKDRNTQE